jgi:hypothetical protein
MSKPVPLEVRHVGPRETTRPFGLAVERRHARRSL